MKTLALALFVISHYAVSAQQPDKFSIVVTIEGSQQNGKAYLRYFTAKGIYLDSANLKNGKFQFTGSLTQKLIQARIHILSEGERKQRKEDACEILLEPTNIKVNASKNLLHSRYSGSQIQAQYSELYQSLIPIKTQQFVIDANFESAELKNDESAKDRILNIEYPQLFLNKQRILGEFIKKYPSSQVSASKFEEFVGDDIDPKVVEPVYQILSHDLKKMPNIEEVAKRIVISKRTAIGMPAIDFSQADPNGKIISLSSFKGKYVLVDFWASWCGPCRAETPMFRKLYSLYADRGFEIVSISLDGEKEAWIKAIAKDKMIWPQAGDLQIFDNLVAKQYGVASIPQNFLISPDGKIIAKGIRGLTLEKTLEELFK